MIFIFDENLPKSITVALNVLQQRMNKKEGTQHKVEHSTIRFPQGTKDPNLIKNFPKNGILITMDIGQQRKWHEKILIEKEKISVVYYRSKRSLRYWQLALLFINSWQDLLFQVQSKSFPLLKVYRPMDVRRFTKRY